MSVATEAQVAWLIPVAGPAIESPQLRGATRPLLIGRSNHCDVRLASDGVSRSHAAIRFDGIRWRMVDLGSRWGTFINGIRVEPRNESSLEEGDLIRITPWTFRFTSRPLAKAGLLDGAMDAVDDLAEVGKNLQTLTFDRPPALGDELLALLLESASTIHGAGDEKSLADVLLEKACHGSGLPNAALLRPAGAGGRFEVIAARSAGPTSTCGQGYSRALLGAAADGKVAELSADRQTVDVSNSIVSLGVRSALCVPLMLGQTVAAYLYLDSRGDPNSAGRLPLRPHASAFCLALGRIASLALSNLKRVEMERRGARLEADLAAASEAQQWILPKPKDTLGRFSYIGRSLPGEYLGGDFFDVIQLDEDRIAVAIGDVSGHGVAASVLMTATAGFLHAALEQTGDVAAAVNRLNQFIAPRRAFDRFVTLWVGLLDLRTRTLQHVDAGHSYAFRRDAAGHFPIIKATEQVPVGVDERYNYTSSVIEMDPSGELLLISDGLVEQFGPPGDSTHEEAFGTERLDQVIRQAISKNQDPIDGIFDAVSQYAGNTRLSDDATALLVKW